MTIDRRALKANAKAAMRGRKPSVYLVMLVYFIIVWILNILSQHVSGNIATLQNLLRYYETGSEMYIYNISNSSPGFIGWILSIAISLMQTVLAYGLTIFCVNISRMRKADFGNLFDGFALFFKVIWLSILTGIFVYLWSLLLIIPGVVAAYRYRQAFYILLDHPEMSALECITASKNMMNGHKWELFVLDLSFIGWGLLTVIPFVSVYVTPYMEVTCAGYYDALVGLGSAGGQQPPFENFDPNDRDGGTPPWEL